MNIMTDKQWLKLNLIFGATAITGLLTLGSTLLALVHSRHIRLVLADAHLTVLAGLSLIYLAFLLKRGKYNAWLISLAVYVFLLIRNIQHFVFDNNFIIRHYVLVGFFNLLLPAAALAALILWRRSFKVRSSISSFGLAARRAVLILVVAFLYGVVGFQLLDTRDFRQEIPLPAAMHYTIDQFGLTTNDKPTAYTKRAVIFVDSLASVSIASVFYVVVAFFAPIRFRLSHSQSDADGARAILERYSTTSEDFFKLWPHDKDYYFNQSRNACIAYHVARGVALVVGDPVGPQNEIKPLVQSFNEQCYLNGWTVAFIHTQEHHLSLYENLGFDVQKIGEEAIVDTKKFSEQVAGNKYFRQINNRFARGGFSCELLPPPHSQELIAKLKKISDDWLEIPGRAERGFMMGYFSENYIQQCEIFAVKDKVGEIWAFSNVVPSPKSDEANYDFLRHVSGSPGNINDFLMMNFIKQMAENGVPLLNMGLCPLAGLHEQEGADRSVIDSFLNLVYTKAGRFYSFQGLTRFKNKYEPNWQGRYIVYQGGLPGFGRTMNALLKAMSR